MPFISEEEYTQNQGPDIMSQATQAPKQPGLLTTLAKAVISPVTNYGGMVGEGLYRGGMYALSPKYRSITNKVNRGEELTPEEAQYTLSKKPIFMSEGDVDKFRTVKGGMWEGVKRTAGMEAMLAPALIGPAVGGGLAYQGGMSAGRALASGVVPAGLSAAQIGARAGQAALTGAARGAVAGGLLGLGQGKGTNVKEVAGETAGGAAMGAAVGGVMGYAGAKLAAPAQAAKERARELISEKVHKPVSRMAARTFAKIYQVPQRQSLRDLNAVETATGILDQTPTRKWNSLGELADAGEQVMSTIGSAVDEVVDANDVRIPYDTVTEKARAQMQAKVGFTPDKINEVVRTIGDIQQFIPKDGDIMGAIQGMGLGPDEAQTALNAITQAKRYEWGFAPAAEALKQAGFDDQTATAIADRVMQESQKMATLQAPAMSARQALTQERELSKTAASYYRAYLQSKRPEDEVYYKAYQAASHELKRLIDSATQKTPAMAEAITPERMEALMQVDPEIAKRFMKSPTVGGWRYLMSHWVKNDQLIYQTMLREPTIFNQVAQRLGASVAGGILGTQAGPWGIVAGTILGPTIEPTLATAAEAVRVPLTTSVARGIHGVASGAVPAAMNIAKSNIIGGLARGITTAPVIAGATQVARELIKPKSSFVEE